ncbi:hypothetical protein [Sphingomonas sp. LT1P40]|uniref:hypothetical protein n=1 Tax=Alteristakelama amylovorans TaxID=3096166 RepID=UPI002FC602AA
MFSFAALLLAASPMPATPVSQPETEAPAKEKKICRRVQTVGTRFGPQVCMTRKRWNEMQAANAEDNRRVLKDSERQERDAYLPYARPN